MLRSMPFAFAMLIVPPNYTPVKATCAVVTEAPKPRGYVRRVLVSLNQLLNTLTFGQPDETLSSRWGRRKDKSRLARLACAVLDKVEKCHCESAIEYDAAGQPLAHQLRAQK